MCLHKGFDEFQFQVIAMSQETKKISNKLGQPKKKLEVKVASAFEISLDEESNTLDISQLPKRKPAPEAEDLTFDDDDEFAEKGQGTASTREKKSKYTEAMLRMAKERKQERQAIKKLH